MHMFATDSEYKQYMRQNFDRPFVATIELSGSSSAVTFHDKYRDIPLTFEISGEGDIVYGNAYEGFTANQTMLYRRFCGEWESLTISGTNQSWSLHVYPGDIIQMKNAGYDGSLWSVTFSGTTCQFRLYGNIASLLSGDTYQTVTELGGNLTWLFANCTGLTDAEHLILPFKTLYGSAYQEMFNGCYALQTAPTIEATSAGTWSMERMFKNCSALTVVQSELYLTEFTDGVCNEMFDGCKSLTYTPQLNVASVGSYSLTAMFRDCHNLKRGPQEIAAPVLGQYSCSGMFVRCYQLQRPPTIFAHTYGYGSCSWMFNDCFSFTTLPIVYATAVTDYSCHGMFCGCHSATTQPTGMLSATTLGVATYRQMYAGCPYIERAPILPANVLTEECYREMFTWCDNLNYIECYATNTGATNATTNWVQGVASTGTFKKHPNMAGWSTGVNGTPAGWTVINASI